MVAVEATLIIGFTSVGAGAAEGAFAAKLISILAIHLFACCLFTAFLPPHGGKFIDRWRRRLSLIQLSSCQHAFGKFDHRDLCEL